jgi:hypothetical protein
VITGDHGQSFGEAGNVFHGCGATDSIARVPLVVRPPADYSVPGRVDRWTSLCDIGSWLRAAASGSEPFDEDGVAPMPFSLGSDRSETVFCEGAPASDPNRSLRGVRADARWNHRLLAAYRGTEKFVLDLETSDVFRWPMEGSDPDLTVPDHLDGGEAEAARNELFEPYLRLDGTHVGSPAFGSALPAEIDHRLRSWGYD